MFQQLEQDMVLMKVWIWLEVFELGVDVVPEEQEQLERNDLLQLLVQVRELEKLSPVPQVADEFLILPPLVPLIGSVFALVLELLRVV